MELEEMKNLWQQHDAQLKQNQLLNENIIKHMLNDKSGSAINKMLNWEYFNMVFCIVLLAVFATQYWNLGNNTGITTCYIATLISVATAIAFGLYKTRYLSGINFATDTVTNIMQKLEKFRLLIARERTAMIVIFPLMLFPTYVVVNYWVHHANMLDNLSSYKVRITLAFILGIVASIGLYKRVYFHNIQQIKANLAEIEEFKKG